MNQPNQQNKPPPTSTLAVVSLVFSFLCMPIGVVLAIIALVRISKSNGMLSGKTIAIVALAFSVMWVPITGILAAITIPNFVRFQCRSMQSEAKTNLKALYVAEEGYRGEFNRYGSLDEVGFTARGANIRYRYELVEQGEGRFLARAIGIKGRVQGEEWFIDHENQLRIENNACR